MKFRAALIACCLAAALTGPAFAGGILLLGAGGSSAAGGFSPSQVTLALWLDPSDSTTVWVDTTCNTTPATNGSLVGCIQDKSGNARHFTFATAGAKPTLTNSSGLWHLDFNGSTTGLDGNSASLAILQNVGTAVSHVAANGATSGVQPAIYFSIGTDATGSRVVCGVNYSGTGWGIRGRRLDADAGVNVAVGSTSSALQVVRCDVEYSTALANIFINNVSTVSPTAFQTSGSTDNTAGLYNGLGFDGTVNNSHFNGSIYGVIVQVNTTSMTAIDTWLCTKAGLSC